MKSLKIKNPTITNGDKYNNKYMQKIKIYTIVIMINMKNPKIT